MNTQLRDMICSCDKRCLALSGKGNRSLIVDISPFIWSRRCLEAPLFDLKINSVNRLVCRP